MAATARGINQVRFPRVGRALASWGTCGYHEIAAVERNLASDQKTITKGLSHTTAKGFVDVKEHTWAIRLRHSFCAPLALGVLRRVPRAHLLGQPLRALRGTYAQASGLLERTLGIGIPWTAGRARM